MIAKPLLTPCIICGNKELLQITESRSIEKENIKTTYPFTYKSCVVCGSDYADMSDANMNKKFQLMYDQ